MGSCQFSEKINVQALIHWLHTRQDRRLAALDIPSTGESVQTLLAERHSQFSEKIIIQALIRWLLKRSVLCLAFYLVIWRKPNRRVCSVIHDLVD